MLMQALETFLDARREWLLHALQVSLATGLDSADAASARLAVIAAQIQVGNAAPLAARPEPLPTHLWHCNVKEVGGR